MNDTPHSKSEWQGWPIDRESLPAGMQPDEGASSLYPTREVKFRGPSARDPNLDASHLWIKVLWWKVDGRWRPEGVSIELARGSGLRALRGGDLRKLSFGEIINAAADKLEEQLDDPHCFAQTVDSYDLETGEWTSRPNDELDLKARPRKRLSDPAWLADTVRVYNEALDAGRNPTRAVQEHFEKTSPGFTMSNAKRRVFQARHVHGKLPKVPANSIPRKASTRQKEGDE